MQGRSPDVNENLRVQDILPKVTPIQNMQSEHSQALSLCHTNTCLSLGLRFSKAMHFCLLGAQAVIHYAILPLMEGDHYCQPVLQREGLRSGRRPRVLEVGGSGDSQHPDPATCTAPTRAALQSANVGGTDPGHYSQIQCR